MKSVHAWLSEVLREGAIGTAKWTADGLQIGKETAYLHYRDWSEIRRDYRTHAKNSWVREIKRLFGPLVKTEYRDLRSVTRHLKFAPLEKCRAVFQTYAGSSVMVGGADTSPQSQAGTALTVSGSTQDETQPIAPESAPAFGPERVS
jgi:hypothetical protein